LVCGENAGGPVSGVNGREEGGIFQGPFFKTAADLHGLAVSSPNCKFLLWRSPRPTRAGTLIGPNWVREIKHDGYRIIVCKKDKDGSIQLSRAAATIGRIDIHRSRRP
jgi:hypothetical protein